MNSLLKMINISKKFKNQIVLDKINLNINEGDIYGLIGENGVGKTTVIKIITGLLKPDNGKIFFENNDITTNRFLSNNYIKCLFDDSPQINHLNVKEYLIYFSLLSTGKKNIEKINELMETFRLLSFENRKVSKLSLGMRKKLYLATGFITTPKLLILDEPLNGLDVKAINEFKNILIRINKKYNCTIIISSHLLSELSLICNKVGIIKNGSIIEKNLNIDSPYQYVNCIIKSKEIINLKTFIRSNYDYKIIDIDSFSISIKIIYSEIENFIENIIKNRMSFKEFYVDRNRFDYYFSKGDLIEDD